MLEKKIRNRKEIDIEYKFGSQLEQKGKGVRVTFLRGADDAKDGWERADGNKGKQRNKKQAQEEQVWVWEEKPTGR